eukprot:1461883-Pleurochrysis_carterae.AAC.1
MKWARSHGVGIGRHLAQHARRCILGRERRVGLRGICRVRTAVQVQRHRADTPHAHHPEALGTLLTQSDGSSLCSLCTAQ